MRNTIYKLENIENEYKYHKADADEKHNDGSSAKRHDGACFLDFLPRDDAY